MSTIDIINLVAEGRLTPTDAAEYLETIGTDPAELAGEIEDAHHYFVEGC